MTRLVSTFVAQKAAHANPTMPPPLPDPEIDDEDYASEEDSDFAPEKVAGEEGESSDSEDDTTTATKAAAPTDRKRKQAGDGGDHDDAGFENSGDESIIEKAKKRRKKGQQQQARADLQDDEAGEGGLIKTRSMRAVECVTETSLFICPGFWRDGTGTKRFAMDYHLCMLTKPLFRRTEKQNTKHKLSPAP